jgi:hypothetical protein
MPLAADDQSCSLLRDELRDNHHAQRRTSVDLKGTEQLKPLECADQVLLLFFEEAVGSNPATPTL